MAMAGSESGGPGAVKGPRLPPSNTDRRLVDKTLKRLDKLNKLCTNPRLALKNSPPYLPELLSETSMLLSQVWEPFRGTVVAALGQESRGDESEYLKIHVRQLLDKTDRAMLLFKEGRDKIFVETSSYRCIVQWSSFKQQLRAVFPFEEGMEAMALKSTVDVTCNDSVFEFDIFTRLFQPWRSLLRNWNQLAVTHPGYMAFLTYDQAMARLGQYLHRPGSYIFRLSCTRMGQWAIGHVTNNRGIIQTIPENTPLLTLCTYVT